VFAENELVALRIQPRNSTPFSRWMCILITKKSAWSPTFPRSRRLSTKQQQLFWDVHGICSIGIRKIKSIRKRKLSTTWSPKIVRSLKLSCCWLDQSKVLRISWTCSYKASISSVGCGLKRSRLSLTNFKIITPRIRIMRIFSKVSTR